MAIWDRPKQATVRVSDNLVVRSYGNSEGQAVEELRRYAGLERLAEWERQSGERLKVEPYSGKKRGVLVEYERALEAPKEASLEVLRKPSEPAQAVPGKVAQELEAEGVSVRGEGVTVRRTEQGLRIDVAPGARNVTININMAELPPAGKDASTSRRTQFENTLQKAQREANAYDRELGVSALGPEKRSPPDLRPTDGRAAPDKTGKTSAAPDVDELRREARADADMRQSVVQSDRREDVVEEQLSQVGGGAAHVEAPDRTIGKGVATRMAGMAPIPAAGAGAEWRGTITDALQEVRARHGDVAFASGDWERQSRVRVYSARELTDTVERVRDLIEPEKNDVKAYTVKPDGTIHNVVTNRDEFVALSGQAFQVRPELEARIEREKGERATVTRGAERKGSPEISVGSS